VTARTGKLRASGIRVNNDDTSTTNATIIGNTITGTGNGGGGIPVNNGEGITCGRTPTGR
jgi:hypothetical protein